MDPLSIVASVCALATALQVWLSARAEQSELTHTLGLTVTRIRAIILPFQAEETVARLEPTVVDTFRGLGEALARTRDHLVQLDGGEPAGQEPGKQKGVGRGKGRDVLLKTFNFLRPAEVAKKLREDERQLTNQLVLVLFGVTMQSFFQKGEPGRGGASASASAREAMGGDVVLSGVKNEEIREFWRDYVGAKVVCVPPQIFIVSIKTWFKAGLPESTCRHLLLRLDEYAVGGVTPHSLENLVGEQRLRDVIEGFKQQNEAKSHELAIDSVPRPFRHSRDSATALPEYTVYPNLPLIIWVDDMPSNNIGEVTYARSLGISVIELTSTALAKAWFEDNEEFVRANDTPSRIRVISDNARYESDSVLPAPSPPTVSPSQPQSEDSFYLNMSAGEHILRYLRGRQYRMPVLVYCGWSIFTTQYVLQYEEAGSTVGTHVVRAYCEALAKRKSSDTFWRRFSS
ncbi:hypothetical protein CALCODRAFT_515263 [Calocera cornea HHB12733]|uniref:Uncharacterized protein n=1 Tax=Calocera cornea HHB12733 TaxID=1353952 RepID=A0A165IJU5_9BASI|nr:hypothetical protein CALCODRAFT_515263 [Calocera cornea HHB12733]